MTPWEPPLTASVPDDTLDYVTSPAEAAADPEEAPAPGKQRLRIHVPDVSTTLTMGARSMRDHLRDDDRGPVNFDGFGVHTEGKIYMCAEDDVGVKATGNIEVHTAGGNIDMRAADFALFGSDNKTFIHGVAGAMIVGGSQARDDIIRANLPAFAADKFYGEEVEPVPWQLNHLNQAKEDSEQMIQTIKMVQGSLLGLTRMAGAKRNIWGTMSATFALNKIAQSLLASEPGPGVGIHGAEGVWMTSPKTVSMHAHRHVLVSSGGETDVQSLVSVSLGGGLFAFVGAGAVSTIVGGVGANLFGGWNAELAARRAKAKIRGKEIVLGSNRVRRPQRKCQMITAYSENMRFAAEKHAHIRSESTAGVSSKKATLHGDRSAWVTSQVGAYIYGQERATLRSMESVQAGTRQFGLQADNREIKLHNRKGPGPRRPQPPPGLRKMYERISVDEDEEGSAKLGFWRRMWYGRRHAAYLRQLESWQAATRAFENSEPDACVRLTDRMIELKMNRNNLRVLPDRVTIARDLVVRAGPGPAAPPITLPEPPAAPPGTGYDGQAEFGEFV